MNNNGCTHVEEKASEMVRVGTKLRISSMVLAEDLPRKVAA